MFSLQTFPSLSSTQNHARSFIENKTAKHGMVIHADTQTDGHGRMGRRWDGAECNLYCSLIIKPDKPMTEWAQLSLMTGVALGETCKQQGRDVVLKWPNDVLFQDKKCAGILIDIVDDYAVIGVGVNTQTAPDDASCLNLDTGAFLHAFMHHFEYRYDIWHGENGWNNIRKQWESLSIPVGAPINVTINGTKQTVTYNGITPDGFLRYHDANGHEHIERNAS